MNKNKNNKLKYSADNKHFKSFDDSASVKGDDVAANFVDKASLSQDPFGSWTGKPKDYGEQPVQDADDI